MPLVTVRPYTKRVRSRTGFTKLVSVKGKSYYRKLSLQIKRRTKFGSRVR